MAQDVGEKRPILHRCGDIVEYQLVRPGLIIKAGQFHRVVYIAHILKIDALYHFAISNIQAGDDAFADHCFPSPSRLPAAQAMAWAKSRRPL